MLSTIEVKQEDWVSICSSVNAYLENIFSSILTCSSKNERHNLRDTFLVCWLSFDAVVATESCNKNALGKRLLGKTTKTMGSPLQEICSNPPCKTAFGIDLDVFPWSKSFHWLEHVYTICLQMSSTFSLVEVTAQYLDSPSKLHTAMHLCIIFKHGQKSQSRCISLQATWACRPQVPISARLSPVVGLQAPDTTLKPWCCPTKKEFQCYLACSGNSHLFENVIFLEFPKSLSFYHWEDYLHQKYQVFI